MQPSSNRIEKLPIFLLAEKNDDMGVKALEDESLSVFQYPYSLRFVSSSTISAQGFLFVLDNHLVSWSKETCGDETLNMTINHKPCESSIVADALPRLPVAEGPNSTHLLEYIDAMHVPPTLPKDSYAFLT
jgi:hypothetical protein